MAILNADRASPFPPPSVTTLQWLLVISIALQTNGVFSAREDPAKPNGQSTGMASPRSASARTVFIFMAANCPASIRSSATIRPTT